MLEPLEILEDVIAFFQPKRLDGQHVLVTAGPTFEAIDPVRGITNLSSGKMGFAIARAAQECGAQVTLVAGPVSLDTPRHVSRIDVRSALQMHAAVLPLAPRHDVFARHRGGGRLASGAVRHAQDQRGRLGAVPTLA
jgi:phosphopantothenoylcysteine decarboxylase/phosphopantothenate--cysteine ligase